MVDVRETHVINHSTKPSTLAKRMVLKNVKKRVIVTDKCSLSLCCVPLERE